MTTCLARRSNKQKTPQTSKTSLAVLVLLSILSIVMLYSTNTASALSETECLSLSNLGSIEQSYTVVTCDNPFNVSVNMGQRLHIQNPSGGSNNMLPSASYGSVGTYAYSSGSATGTIKLQNPPDVGIIFQNVQVSFSGSQMSVSGNIINSNNFPVKNLYVYWHVMDSSGNYLTSWHRSGNDGQAYSTQIPAQSSGSFSETVCCLPNSGATQATPYLVQAFREDGTKLISTSNPPAKPQDGSFVLPCSMQEKGDGVFTSSCNGVYENGFAKAKVGINYGSGLFPIKNYEAVGFFIDKNGNQGQNIKVKLDQINPKESKELVFVNPISGFVSEFKMQMLGGTLVTETTPQPPINYSSEVTVVMAQGAASNTQCGDKCFVPNTVTVAIGGKVTWKNVDSAAHTATAVDGSFDTSLVNAGASASNTFKTAGSYQYMCILHPWSKGTVIVGGTPVQPTPQPNQYEFEVKSPPNTVVTLDKTKYSGGDLMTIRGSGFLPSQTITILILGSSQNQITELTMSSTQTGTFQTLWPVPVGLDYEKYTIQVSQPILEPIPQEDDKSVNVIISGIEPSSPKIGEQVKIKFNFLNPKTDKIQEHIDYTVTITRNGQTIFGLTPLTHSSIGQITIPITYQGSGKYQATIDIQGILFRPIPSEKSTIGFNIGKDSTSKKSTVNESEELERQKAELAKEKARLEAEKKKLEEQKKSVMKTKDQLAKEKEEKLKKQKELAKKKAIEKAKQKAMEKAKQKAKETAQKKSNQNS